MYFVCTFVLTKRYKLVRTIMVKYICDYCGEEFSDYKSNDRKFCSRDCADKNRRMNIILKCTNCNKQLTHKQTAGFVRNKRCYPNERKNPFCSTECFHAYRRKRITKKCSNCGKEFKVKVSRRDTAKFCSISCKTNDKRIRNSILTNKEHKRVRQRLYQRKARRNLNDWYIKNLIQQNHNLNYKDIPESLVNTKREHLKITRLINDRKQ